MRTSSLIQIADLYSVMASLKNIDGTIMLIFG